MQETLPGTGREGRKLLWSGRYDRELKDIFAIQDEISRGVVNNLRLKLGRGRPALRNQHGGARLLESTTAWTVFLQVRAEEMSVKPFGV
jgi:hypothetical protein